jgi:hypothetical protein
MGLAAPDHTVPYGTVLWRTLSQALRARLRSVCPYGTGLQTLRNGRLGGSARADHSSGQKHPKLPWLKSLYGYHAPD